MHQWHPDRRDLPMEQVYPDLPPPDRDRWVALNMVSSLDGAVTIGGVSGPLGGGGDLAGFRALRAAVDVVLVGAGTARAERYGPPKVPAALQDARLARGQQRRPAVAVVTASLDLTGAERLLDGTVPVVAVTAASAPADRRAALEARGVEVLASGDDTVDLPHALDVLAARGQGRVLCEGGPRLNRDLLSRGLVDDVFLTVAPVLVGGADAGIVAGPLPAPVDLRLREGREHEGELLLRYQVVGPRRDRR